MKLKNTLNQLWGKKLKKGTNLLNRFHFTTIQLLTIILIFSFDTNAQTWKADMDNLFNWYQLHMQKDDGTWYQERWDQSALLDTKGYNVTDEQWNDYRANWNGDTSIANNYENNYGIFYYHRIASQHAYTEIRNRQLPYGGVIIWLIYNTGFVIKTHDKCFAIDLVARDAEDLADVLDFLIVSHNHSDHKYPALLNAMAALGKPIYAPFTGTGVTNITSTSSFTQGQVGLRFEMNDQGGTTCLVSQINCGADANNYTLYMMEDSRVLSSLNPTRHINLMQVDIANGYDPIAAVNQVNPDKAIYGHQMELGHDIADGYRWKYDYSYNKINGTNHAKSLIPTWGEKIDLSVPGTVQYTGPVQINDDSTLEIFGTGPNSSGNVWHRRQLASGLPNHSVGYWADWENLQGGVVADKIAVARNVDHTLEIFADAQGTSGNVYYKRQTSPNGTFGSWVDMGGTGLSNLRTGYCYDGCIRVFGVDASGNINYNTQTAPNTDTWTGWSQIINHTIQPGFAVATNKDGRLIFAGCETGSNHHIFLKHQGEFGGGWEAWIDLNNINGTGTKKTVRFGRNQDGRLELYGQSSNGNVWHCYQQNGGNYNSWSGWSDMGKSLKEGFAVATDKNGCQVVMGIASASPYHFWEKRQTTPNGGWGSWIDRGVPSGVQLDGNLMTGIASDGDIQFFSQGNDGKVWSHWESGTSWNPWTNLDFGGSDIAWKSAIHPEEDAETETMVPGEFSLIGNYPNPFNPTTKICFGLAEKAFVRLNVYNLLGENVASLVNNFMDKGTHEVNFDASGLTSGIYLYRIEAGSFVQTKKMLLMK